MLALTTIAMKRSRCSRLAATGAAGLNATQHGIDGHSEQQYSALDHLLDLDRLALQVEAILEAADDEHTQYDRPDRATPTEEADAANHRRSDGIQQERRGNLA